MNIVCCLGEEAANEHGEDFARSYYDIEMNAFNPLPLIAPWLPIASNKIVQNSRKRLLAILASEARYKFLSILFFILKMTILDGEAISEQAKI
jgi:hypothetical protein